MTAKWPREGFLICNALHHAASPAAHRRQAHVILISRRQYATNHRNASAKPFGTHKSVNDPVKGALTAVEQNEIQDPLNPPRSTLPPPLDLPTRGGEQKAVYWLRIGRAYGRFYKDGIKAVWNNWSAAKLLKQRLGDAQIEDVVRDGKINRAEFQMLARNRRDVGKLPFFGLLVLIFGEWLPLLVPFMPNAVPGTCRIPKQIRDMQAKAEARRVESFRMGISEPSHKQLPSGLLGGKEERSMEADNEWSVAFNPDYRTRLVSTLRLDQLHHLSTTLGVNSTFWNSEIVPSSRVLRRRIAAHLAYLAQDDTLLLRSRRQTAHLSQQELHLACAERGLDVLGKADGALREVLTWWLRRQREDRGMGTAMMVMLFRRPNAWDTKAGLNAPPER